MEIIHLYVNKQIYIINKNQAVAVAVASVDSVDAVAADDDDPELPLENNESTAPAGSLAAEVINPSNADNIC
jgi:hypothetical protein